MSVIHFNHKNENTERNISSETITQKEAINKK
jgi:hypothetical protein